MDTLAFLEGRGKLSIAALLSVQARQLPKGSSVILITPTVDPELSVIVDDLQRRNLQPLVVLLDAGSFDGLSGADGIVRQLTERRAPVCLIPCGADLGQALSLFSTTHVSQDIDRWQRPTLSHLT